VFAFLVLRDGFAHASQPALFHRATSKCRELAV
jgi:hypothetical protein